MPTLGDVLNRATFGFTTVTRKFFATERGSPAISTRQEPPTAPCASTDGLRKLQKVDGRDGLNESRRTGHNATAYSGRVKVSAFSTVHVRVRLDTVGCC